MNLERIGYRPLLLWLSLGVLVALGCVLGILQYRWIGEISQAEQNKLQDSLQSSLSEVSRDFNSELSSTYQELIPRSADVEQFGRVQAFERRYVQWKSSTSFPGLFRRVAIASQSGERIALWMLDPNTEKFVESAWPPDWSRTRERLSARVRGPGDFRPPPPGPPPARDQPDPAEASIIVAPRPGPASFLEQDWLLVDVDAPIAAHAILPQILARHLGDNYSRDYKIEVFERSDPAVKLYQAGNNQADPSSSRPDASVLTFDPGAPMRGPGLGPEGRGRGPLPGRGGERDLPPEAARGRWELTLRLHAGSLETVVAKARRRNLAVSGAILLLMLATGAGLVRFSRQAQRLAEMQMEFVTGVSHELRTPLTVIRTAAFNLRGKLASNPSQVERYGALIQQESEKLTAIVEQVLQFARAKAGQVIHGREPVSVEYLIEDTLQSSRGLLEEAVCQVEKQLEPGLPLILADSQALRHALQNLIGNAVKYGMSRIQWIGIFARAVSTGEGPKVEIRVADRGPGIPADERARVFDAFFRGRKALLDQKHGTGLGLNLVKKIVEAHGGTVVVESQVGSGTTFVVTIPAIPRESQVELANSLG